MNAGGTRPGGTAHGLRPFRQAARPRPRPLRRRRPRAGRHRRPRRPDADAQARVPREARRRRGVQDGHPLPARRRPAHRHRRARRGRALRRARPGPPRRHRHRQDLHHGQDHRGDAAPRDHPRPEQDPGGAALRRVQAILPRERGRILRQLLRLLPARGLRPPIRYLYREGIADQRADRPDAPLGDPGSARARRRHHRRLRVLHLRHRLGRDLFRHDPGPPCRPPIRPAHRHGRPRRPAIPPQRCRLLPRLLPRARRRGRGAPRPPGGPRLAPQLLRRRPGGDHRVRPAHRQEDRRDGPHPHLRQFPLRDAQAHDEAGHGRHPRRIEDAPRPARRRGQAAGGAAPRAAHQFRPRDAGGHRRLQRDRELLPLPHRPRPRRAAAHPLRVHPRQRHRLRRRIPRLGPADRRDVQGRLPPQVHPRRARIPPALLHGQPPPQVRGVERHAPAIRLRLRHPLGLGIGAIGRRLRRAGDPPHRPFGPHGRDPPRRDAGRRPPRRDPPRDEGRQCAPSSPPSPSAWPRT